MSNDRLTFKSFKNDKAETNLKPSQPFPVRQPPGQSLLCLSKIAFQFCVLGNLALSAYILVRAKQRDEINELRSKQKKSPPNPNSTVSPGSESFEIN